MICTGWNQKATARYMGLHRNTLYKWLLYERDGQGGRRPSKSATRLAALYQLMADDNTPIFEEFISNIYVLESQHDGNGVAALLTALNGEVESVALIMGHSKRAIYRWCASAAPEQYSANYRRMPDAVTNQLALAACSLLRSTSGTEMLDYFKTL